MTEPSLDLEKPNAVGALDRITTNVAVSLIAVVPTFFTCMILPWRLTALLKRDDPEGRSGMLLSPGAFFPLSLLVSFLIGALLTTPEIAQNDGSFLGPNLALSIQSAVADGDVWKTIGTVMPIYVFAVIVGSLGLILKPWAHGDWTLRVSLRAVFYITGTFVSWVILTTAAIGVVRESIGDAELARRLNNLFPIPTLGLIFWMFFWFFRDDGALSLFRSALLSIAIIGLTLLALIGLATLSSL